MGDVEGIRYPSSHSDVYHGRADGAGGSVWVYSRIHSTAGLYVEAHLGAPDGPLIRRAAAWHHSEAKQYVEQWRATVVRRGVRAVEGEIEPLVARGRLLVHGAHGNHSSDAMVIDGTLATLLCAEVWVPPGVHDLRAWRVWTASSLPPDAQLRRPPRTRTDIEIEPESTTEIWVSTLRHRVLEGHPHFHWPCVLRAGRSRGVDG